MKLIDRLSEDIDLSLAPDFLGIGEPVLDASLSKGQASKWMKKAEAECIELLRSRPANEGGGLLRLPGITERA